VPGKTDWMENAVLNTLRGNALSFSAVYVGLFTTLPNDNGTGGTEVSGGGYARQAVTFGAPSNGSMSNSADITFPLATANWGTIVGFGIFDAATGGNLLYFGSLTTSKSIESGDQLRFPAGNLTITED